MTSWLLMLACSIPAADTAAAPESARPYRIALWMDVEGSSAEDSQLTNEIVNDLLRTIARIFGEAWDVTHQPCPLDARALPEPDLAQENGPSFDKVFFTRLSTPDSSGARQVRAYEYDAILHEWGPPVVRVIYADSDLSEGMFRAISSAFRPVARIMGRDRGKVLLSLRAQTLVPISSGSQLALPGTPFVIVRVPADRPGESSIVPWSYLINRSAEKSPTDRLVTQADIASVFRNPLSSQDETKTDLWAVACPDEPDGKTVIQFRNRENDRPIVGYDVAVRQIGQTSALSIGSTDFRGEITVSRMDSLTARNTTPVIDVLLRSGQTVIARLPLVPGSPRHCEVPILLDPILPEIAGQVLTLQEEVIDQVAKRKMLERKLKQAEQSKNIPLAQSIVDKLNAMPNRMAFTDQLQTVKQNADMRSKELKQASLGLNVKRLFSQTEFLLNSIPKEGVVLKTTKPKPAPRTRLRKPAIKPAP